MTTPFTYAGPSVAATLTTGVLNTAWDLATQKSADADSKTTTAVALATNAAHIKAPDDLANLPLPTAPIISFDPNKAQTTYDATAQALTASLTASFLEFLQDYFPLGTELAAAAAWVERALTTGGAGVNTVVEDQLWNRDRDRILNDAARAEDEAVSSWAARGYPLPPGAAAHQVHLLHRNAQTQIAESSRERATKTFEIEIENARLAVDKAISLRTSAVSSAGEYIRALALGPQLGAQLASTLVNAEATLASTTAEFYRAQVSALEIPLRIGTTNIEMKMRASESNQKADMDALRARVDVTMAAAQALSQQAAAMLNGFHAAVGVSGSESL